MNTHWSWDLRDQYLHWKPYLEDTQVCYWLHTWWFTYARLSHPHDREKLKHTMKIASAFLPVPASIHHSHKLKVNETAELDELSSEGNIYPTGQLQEREFTWMFVSVCRVLHHSFSSKTAFQQAELTWLHVNELGGSYLVHSILLLNIMDTWLEHTLDMFKAVDLLRILYHAITLPIKIPKASVNIYQSKKKKSNTKNKLQIIQQIQREYVVPSKSRGSYATCVELFRLHGLLAEHEPLDNHSKYSLLSLQSSTNPNCS